MLVPRHLRISLRNAMLLFTAVVLAIGIPISRGRQQARIAARIEELGGTVFYDYQYSVDSQGQGHLVINASPPGNWVARLLGRDYWHSIIGVNGFRLQFYDNVHTREDGFTFRTYFGPSKRETEFLTNTDRCLPSLEGIGGLLWIDLSDTAVTDDGLAHLTRLPGVEKVRLKNTAITDAGLDQLAQVRGLEAVTLRSTQVSEAGLQRLQSRCPDLIVGHHLAAQAKRNRID